MKKREALFVPSVMVVGFLINACGLVPQRHSEVHKIDSDSPTIISYPASIRAAYVFNPDSKYRYCSEPSPDVALATVTAISANLKFKGTIDAGVAAKLTADVVQLAGRTQLVLVARDMLYSLCVLTLNHEVAQKDLSLINAMYSEVAAVIITLAQADKKRAEAAAAKAQIDLTEIRKEIDKQDKMIGRIVHHVTNKKGEIISENLKALVEGAKKKSKLITASTERQILRVKTADELRQALKEDIDWAVDPLFDQLPG